jgi:nitrogen-specific signal transduction histidine kinase
MSRSFDYRRLGGAFQQELAATLLRGESALLLGPRDAGKRNLVHRLPGEFPPGDRSRWLAIELLASPVANTNTLREAVARAVEKTIGEPAVQLPAETGRLVGAALAAGRRLGAPLFVVLANVDSLPHALACQLLRDVQRAIGDGQIVALLTGEIDLREIIDAAVPELNSVRNFIIQGFEEEAFAEYCDERAERLSLLGSPDFATYARRLAAELLPGAEFANPAAAFFAVTGGQIHLLRPLLWLYVENRDRARAEDRELVLPHEHWGVSLFRRATQIVERSHKCLDLLQRLLAGERPEAWEEPDALELSGMIVRREGRFDFSSPLARVHAQHQFSPRHLADLFALQGDWKKAFDIYESLLGEARVRPLGGDEHVRFARVVEALGARLREIATGSALSEVERTRLRILFARGCRLLLGFEVTFWRALRSGAWQPLDAPKVSESARLLAEGWPGAPACALENSPVTADWSDVAIGCFLPDVRGDARLAVVVGDWSRGAPLAPERRKWANHLLEHFRATFTHVTQVLQDKINLDRREKLGEIVREAFNVLDEKPLDTRAIVERAAQLLLRDPFRYRRALFCLVDAKRERIEGVYDGCLDSAVDAAKATSYPLSDPNSDIQSYLVNVPQPIIVDDPQRTPRINQDLARRAEMRAMALLPICNPTGEVLGTIHVERSDGTPPSDEEVSQLLGFAEKLAVALDQSESVTLLMSALDKTSFPLAVIDQKERLRYANEPAHALLGMPVGWRHRRDAVNVCEFLRAEVLRNMRQALQTGRRRVEHVPLDGERISHELLTDAICDLREQRVGALVQLTNVEFVLRVLEAFGAFAQIIDRPTLVEKMIEAVQRLGFHSGRVWLREGEGSQVTLLIDHAFNLEDPAQAEEFNNPARKISLQASHPSHRETWRCLKENRAVVFGFDPELGEGVERRTARGLSVINAREPLFHKELRKKPGNLWIDLPLSADGAPYGKITLDCDEDFQPENFELVEALFQNFGALLGALLRKEQLELREREVEAAADRAVADTGHVLRSELGPLPALLARYRWQARECPELAPLNERFEKSLNYLLALTDRAKRLLRGVQPYISPINIEALIRERLTLALGEEGRAWNLKAEADFPQKIQADENLLRDLVFELVSNSRTAARDPRIEVTLRAGEAGRVQIVYRDFGPGVPSDFKHAIFNRFFSNRPGQQPGTGLGLAYVRKICEAHGGSIREVGVEGEGAEFRIELHTNPTQITSQPISS